MKKRILRYDILKELFNISVGKAASMLSEITNKRIFLDVPNVEILNLENKNLRLEDYFPMIINGTLMISSIAFEKKLTGKANLIFPAKKMKKFVDICYGQYEDNNIYGEDFTNVDFDIIKEIGNIILNSIIGEVGNHLDIKLDYTLPEVKVFNTIDFRRDIKYKQYKNVLILYITFVIDEIEIEGAVIIDLTLQSLKELMKKIDSIEDELYG
ncbi:chemotaxis protein CheC [Clostridium tyrobutyricum]|uniref:CheC, inhibitor of MCP methylation n=1 Tax=Clostridium tyrobutyricum DIVETGP TaxID=1408889 RepID=W6N889_CLOTY|nr:chemotaxis protein CheC [Clostridium tyrobutyricum]AND84677.1 chemotaxis protein CheC, inhibitor of MCP methylation [Clostridium tyrobutyricum]ANP69276.1 chemotaxis protein CheC [Clostridium tyrobutyricum]MBR9648401.1 chemotaxis protein CheC [Clostridium tyrobutyricum]MBV4416617.1 chemotaxis protein CheC [Clostridium tyrobutyricum]MBV4421264.1 chemotaxis protein CheC [Clostridium tyrobutyricum]